jgi:hypothetical protein
VTVFVSNTVTIFLEVEVQSAIRRTMGGISAGYKIDEDLER